jgi:uncharacterized protein (TIGR03083 family)
VTDDRDLEGLDPFDVFDQEAARLGAWFLGLDDDAPVWARPSRCAGWSVRDVLAHLSATERYHHASLAGTVAAHFGDELTDVASWNEAGIRALDDRSPSQIAAEWQQANEQTRRGFRERGDGMVDTSVGAYPCRWQAFHLAGELAVHGDDMGVPSPAAEQAARRRWRAPFSRFALLEAKPGLAVGVDADGRTRVRGDGLEVVVDDDDLIEAVAGRLDDSSRLDGPARALLNTMP